MPPAGDPNATKDTPVSPFNPQVTRMNSEMEMKFKPRMAQTVFISSAPCSSCSVFCAYGYASRQRLLDDARAHREARAHARTHLNMHARMHACACARAHKHTCAYTHTHTLVHKYTHTLSL